MQNDLTDIKNSLIASSEHFNSSADEIKLTAIKFRDTSERFDVSIDRLGNIFSPIELLVKDVYLKIAPPIKSATGFVSAASKAVSVFSDVLLRKKK